MIHHRFKRDCRQRAETGELDLEASFHSHVTAQYVDDVTMASLVLAAGVGVIAGGGITGVVSWLTGGDHDTYGKGAKVVYIEPTFYISLPDNLDDPKVYKDESSSFIHLPKMQWTTELIIAVLCAGLMIHLLGGIWGWLGGRKHAKESAEKEHAVKVAELKADHAKDMGSYLSEQARHQEIIRNLREQVRDQKEDFERRATALTAQQAADLQKHESEIKVAHSALAKLVYEAHSDDDDDEEEEGGDAGGTLGRKARSDHPTQGGARPRATSVHSVARKKKKSVEQFLHERR